jgi:hypothetical protein
MPTRYRLAVVLSVVAACCALAMATRSPEPASAHIACGFTVYARVTLVRPEDDGDFHLVLVDGSARFESERRLCS